MVAQPPSTQVTPRNFGLPRHLHLPLLLWNSHASPEPPRPAPIPRTCWLPAPSIIVCWYLDLAHRTLPWCEGKAGAGDAAGQPPPEAELFARWLLGPSSAPVVAWEGSDGLRAVGRGGKGSGAGGWAGRGGSPGPVCARGRPAPALPCTSSFHPPPFTHPVAHSYRAHPFDTYAPATLHSVRT